MHPVFLKRAEVVKLVGLGYTTIYRLEQAGKFPARKQLSAGRVGWLQSEVTAWIESRMAA
ncbi:MAG: AlpA family phage regulatory protein [Geobacteraceae bacterium]|nr:AlpA family phage regulatory protein [Geobacteraceae bacterium]